ncbi:MAG: hypothetical protein HY455_01790 [Parcubacteria group bacterium]|nr:hypothetical protein [Parcubacteria group bacterium]
MAPEKTQIRWGRAVLTVVGFIAALAFVGAIIFRIGWVNFVDNYELGYKYDARTGEISRIERNGYVINPPFLVIVGTIDLRPMQVCINANARVLNCKLVKFNPEGLDLFLSWHGRDYRSGATVPTGTGATALGEILKSYAFDGSSKTYPFLTVLRELKAEDVAP